MLKGQRFGGIGLQREQQKLISYLQNESSANKGLYYKSLHLICSLGLEMLWFVLNVEYTLECLVLETYFICTFLFLRIKESSGWQQVFTSPYLDWTIERVALNAKVVGGPHGDKDKMVAVASESSIILWSIQDGGSGSEIGEYKFPFQ